VEAGWCRDGAAAGRGDEMALSQRRTGGKRGEQVTAIGQWAEQMAALQASALSVAERAQLGLHAYDTVCAMACGAMTPEGQALISLLQPWGSGGAAAQAGLLAALGRMTEIDDIAMQATVTPGALAASALLPFAARGEGEDYASALWVGYETAVCWGKYFQGAAILYQGIWPTYLVAAPAVAATVARLGNFTPEKMAHALAIALSLSSGVAGRIAGGPSSRWLTLALAVESGVKAAWAAAAGYRGDLHLLEAPVWERVTGVGRGPKVEAGRPAFLEVSFKPYAAAKQTMAAVQAFSRGWAGRGWRAEEIQAIRVEVPPAYTKMIASAPGRRWSPLTSVAYLLGLVATDPERLYDVARSGRELGEAGRTLADKVEVEPAEDLTAYYPAHWPARVSVVRDGQAVSEMVVVARGDPEDPLDLEQIQAKYRHCARYRPLAVSPSDLLPLCSLESNAVRGAGRQMLDALAAGGSGLARAGDS
jgi:2-methylcitrate dehydratase PrpD